jgi:hypothetical protein
MPNPKDRHPYVSCYLLFSALGPFNSGFNALSYPYIPYMLQNFKEVFYPKFRVSEKHLWAESISLWGGKALRKNSKLKADR